MVDINGSLARCMVAPINVLPIGSLMMAVVYVMGRVAVVGHCDMDKMKNELMTPCQV